LKRIGYRWVAEKFLVADASPDFSVSLTGIRQAGYLSPIIFSNTQESKMHDSLPLELFSVKTLVFILVTDLPGEVMVVPWGLLVAALTLPNVSTRIKFDCLELEFWFLDLFQDARCPPTRPSSCSTAPVAVRPARPKQNGLYTRAQIRDANNTFVALIILFSCLTQSFSLNLLASDPLEHAFERAWIGCHHVNTMKAMIHVFVGDMLSFP
jgi:hypothetical protein